MSENETKPKDKLTVTLTGRPPVRIDRDAWPVLASAEDSWHDGQIEVQANRITTQRVTVRQHDDSRVLVYARYYYDTHYQGESCVSVAGGVLLDASHPATDDTPRIISAIEGVCAEMDERVRTEGREDSAFARLGHECIADLPPEEL